MAAAEEPPAPEVPGPPRPRSRLWAWGQLLRLPNLFTVPGDPLAGFLLAQAAGLSASRPVLRMALAACVSLLMYAAGLLWNDWFDLAEDRRARAHRPLPSGLVRPGVAALAANVLVAMAIAVAAIAGTTTLYLAMCLGATMLAYDAFAKRLPVIGPLLMGMCRGLSVLVGAAAFARDGLGCTGVLVHAGGTTLYIAAVTWLAAGETRKLAIGMKCGLISAATVAWIVGLFATMLPGAASVAPPGASVCMLPFMAYAIAAGLAGAWILGVVFRLGRRPEPARVQRAVGGLISGLVLMQVAAAVFGALHGIYVAAGLAACLALNRVLARRFYAS